MYALRLFFVIYEQRFGKEILGKNGETSDFFWLVLSTVMIAAAGNVINDYFDIKADRVNRPERQVVGKQIKRRWAIIIHWSLNLTAFLIAVYLGYRNHTFWYLFIHLLSINSLWLYSLYFKKKPVTGNFIIAGLTALVPILCGVHFFIQNSIIWEDTVTYDSFQYWVNILLEDGKIILILAFFAFFNNFAREVIKDIEDIEGDKLIGAKTIPIYFNIGFAKNIAISFLIIPVILFGLLFFFRITENPFSIFDNVIVLMPVVLSLIVNVLATVLLVRSKVKLDFKKVDHLIKFSMILGISTSLYWYFL